MVRSLHTFFYACVCLLAAGYVQAQAPVPFWAENFTNGLPSGWTTTDASGQNVLWTWCSNPLLGDGDPGCSEPWSGGANNQKPFDATTANTGFMVCDSDDPGELASNHIAQLTTPPINCSAQNQVFITFQTHIGVYAVGAEENAILRVSNDGGNSWTVFTLFPGLTPSVRWSANPEIPIVDISSVAANQANVWIQWQWTGNYEYMWSVDDLELYASDPTPQNDMAVSSFFYPASSYSTPVSQIATDVFGFEARLNNNGLNAQTNIKVKAFVKDEAGNELHSQALVVPVLDAGVKDTAITFPDTWAPNLPVGKYFVGYSVSADSVDQRPNNNEATGEFIVSERWFAKESSPAQGIRPSAGGNWAVGNLYQMSAGAFDLYKAGTIEFAFTTNEDELPIADVVSNVYLFKINDDVAADLSDFDDSSFLGSSMEIVGLNTYEAPDTVQGYQYQQVEMLDYNTTEPGVLLQNGARYLLACEYADNNAAVFHAFNDNITYDFPSTFIFSEETWNIFGFGGDANAVLRMRIGLLSTTDEKALPESSFDLLPNPVTETLQAALHFEQPTAATITIADLSGRVIRVEDRQNLLNETLKYPVTQLAAGTYLLRIATAEGTLTKKFVKQ